jgi:hypothetical protein
MLDDRDMIEFLRFRDDAVYSPAPQSWDLLNATALWVKQRRIGGDLYFNPKQQLNLPLLWVNAAAAH